MSDDFDVEPLLHVVGDVALEVLHHLVDWWEDNS